MAELTRRSFLRTSAIAAAGLGVSFGAGPGRVWNRVSYAHAQETVSASALNDLRSRLNGQLMLPGDSGYAAASAPANGRYRKTLPAAVARVADEADVVTCIKWCNENGVPLVGRGGGHSYAGFSTTTGLMVDLRRLNSVTIDKKAGTVVCGGAALNNDYFIATENGPWFLPGGTCLGVGVGGLTLGGGIGYNAHWAGLTCDHMTASHIATASGEILDIDNAHNDDLFWACRGGAGGSFGINTQFSFNLVEVPVKPISWYRFEWTGVDNAAAVLAAFDKILTTAPAALNAVAMAEAIPVGDGGANAAVHIMSRGQYIGPVDDLRDLVAPLLSIGTMTTQTLIETMFWDTQRTIATVEPPSHSFGDVSRYSSAVMPDQVYADIANLIANCPSRSDDANGSFWSLGWVGGEVMDRFSRTETAYVHRNMLTLLRPTTVWPDDAPASVSDGLNGWTEDIIKTISPHTPNESYQNFPNRSIDDWQEQYYGENFQRLVDVKTRYDPSNLFNNPQSVPTRDML